MNLQAIPSAPVADDFAGLGFEDIHAVDSDW
jgi:hypothetical protein